MELNLTSDLSSLTILGFGFLLGLWHAKDPDHLAAVSTIVAEKKSLLNSAFVGGLWGVGHTFSLLVVGALVIFLKLRISESVETKLEALVGVMLVFLGLNALRKLRQKTKIHVHAHEHEGHKHTHIHTHGDETLEETHHFERFSRRSIAVGMVHGLAGSAAVMLLVLPAISSPFTAFFFLFVFGMGSIGGMMLMSFLVGLPLHFTAGRFDVLNKAMLGAAGVFSFGLGVVILYEKLLR